VRDGVLRGLLSKDDFLCPPATWITFVVGRVSSSPRVLLSFQLVVGFFPPEAFTGPVFYKRLFLDVQVGFHSSPFSSNPGGALWQESALR